MDRAVDLWTRGVKSLSDRGEPKIQLNLSDADLLAGIARPKSCAEFGLAFDSPLLGIMPP